MTGLRFESADRDFGPDEKGIPKLLVGEPATLRLFGKGLCNRTEVAVSPVPGPRGVPCQFTDAQYFTVESVGDETARVKVQLPEGAISGAIYHLCVRVGANATFVHAASEHETWL
ncbi:hypothetical protein B566_EDAN002109, partial [Ephemera danica]